jgi:hypothetical protein
MALRIEAMRNAGPAKPSGKGLHGKELVSQQAHQTKVKVLYIAGAGRSGSTLLHRILGQVKGFLPIGEARSVWRTGLLENQLCGCGEPFQDCPFWTNVISAAYGKADVQEILRLQNSVDRQRYVPYMLSTRWRPSPYQQRFNKYSIAIKQLYSTIKTIANCDIIVDSSKDFPYCCLLAKLEDIDLFVVHLIRDSRAMAYSCERKRRQPGKWRETAFLLRLPVWHSAYHWTMVNILYGILKKIINLKSITIHYEDLVERPAQEVERILAFVGSDEPSNITSNSVVLPSSHTLVGNPQRFVVGKVKIQGDIEWQYSMSFWKKAVVSAMTLPLLIKYGYLPRRST